MANPVCPKVSPGYVRPLPVWLAAGGAIPAAAAQPQPCPGGGGGEEEEEEEEEEC